MSRTEAHKIAKQECEAMYEQVFQDCAEDVMQQTLANVLLSLERDYGWRSKRLREFVNNLKGWCDIMQTDTPITKAWTTNDNIDYFKTKYDIDLRKEFDVEVTHG
jgi:hypothetical protein